jgi:deoxyribodipyrimidine photolyase-related protein
MSTIRLILGDQLDLDHSWFKSVDPKIIFLMMEIRSETDYALHHIQKILGFFMAMRSFAQELESKGHKIIYYKIDSKDNEQDFIKNIKKIIAKYKINKLEYQEPDEFRLDQYFKELSNQLGVEVLEVPSEHFLAGRYELKTLYGNKKTYLMENFYRHMRKKHNILMDGSKPLGGKWNYDSENRNKLPKEFKTAEHISFQNDASEIYKTIENQKIKYIGKCKPKKLNWPINVTQAKQALKHFLHEHFENFGTYQDAMSEKDNFIYHSKISFALNTKIIKPRFVIDSAIGYYNKHSDRIKLSTLEGFVRQILGWREYMRSYYWVTMPDFAKTNFFGHENKLPDFYWTGDTKMNCLKNCINSSLDNSYAHHIQRLMVTGNFALMAEVSPDEVDKWYLGIYIDALDWVEVTNTRGMSQWADGGGLATKPYISSANYINNMSDYCKACHYDNKKKYGERACPFNSFYWSFLEKNKNKLSKNQRMSMIYNVWNKMDENEKQLIMNQAKTYKKQIEVL